MENINAEVFTLRNQRKQIKILIDKLKAILGQFDKLENQLLQAQYKHGLMISIDEVGYDEDKFEIRMEELFQIKQKYHHLWTESMALYGAMEKHYNSEEGFFQDLMHKIEDFTPEKIEEIKGLQQEKKIKKEHNFRDMTNINKEIDDLKKVIQDLDGMRAYVKSESPKAYYNKEVKDFNAINDKIVAETEKLEQFKKINNSNMIRTTEAVLRTMEQEKSQIIEKTVAAIDETRKSLHEKIEKRQRISEKYFKIKSLRIFIQGLPWSGKFSLIHQMDPYSSLQRKGNFSVVNSPDYVFSAFKGLLIWVQNEDDSEGNGTLITLPEFEENFEKYKERVKVKFELTCGTGYVDDTYFEKIVEGMKVAGLVFIYDVSNQQELNKSQELFDKTNKIFSHLEEIPTLILGNKNDLINSDSIKSLEDSKLVSIQSDPESVSKFFNEFVNEVIKKSESIQKIMEIEVEG